jgi:hypothetical protein
MIDKIVHSKKPMHFSKKNPKLHITTKKLIEPHNLLKKLVQGHTRTNRNWIIPWAMPAPALATQPFVTKVSFSASVADVNFQVSEPQIFYFISTGRTPAYRIIPSSLLCLQHDLLRENHILNWISYCLFHCKLVF